MVLMLDFDGVLIGAEYRVKKGGCMDLGLDLGEVLSGAEWCG